MKTIKLLMILIVMATAFDYAEAGTINHKSLSTELVQPRLPPPPPRPPFFGRRYHRRVVVRHYYRRPVYRHYRRHYRRY